MPSPETIETVIHPTAVVEPGAELGPGVRIGPYAFVETGARIGAGCRLGPYVHVHGCVTLGPRSIVGTSCALGGEPQDVKYAGEASTVQIGAECRFHEHVTVHRATGAGNRTVIGDGVLCMSATHVGHNAVVGDHVVLVNGAAIGGHAQVAARAILSGQSAVHQFCRVGRLSLVGGACMATRDVPPFSIVTGSYPPVWRAPNTVGLRRAGFSSAQRTAVRRALSALFRSGANPMATAETLREHAEPAVAELAAFVLASQRGVCTGPRGGEVAQVVLLHNPDCSKSRALEATLDARGVTYARRLYLEDPLDGAELRELQRKLGLPAAAMVRSKEAEFAAAGLSSGSSAAEILDAVARHPRLLERPVLIVGERAAIGRPDPDSALALLPA